MKLHAVDIAIMAVYFVAMIGIGIAVAKRAAKGLDSYFLGGHSLPWYILGMSNASAMFDIAGTMWLVYNVFVYGMKGAFLPWMWPTFNQVILMVYLAAWVRRSGVLTGAEWISTRFGSGRGAELSRFTIAIFALLSVFGFVAYSFQGIGKFSSVFLPWDLSPAAYATIIMSATAVYVILGGMVGVVITDLAQFAIMGLSAVAIAVIAMSSISSEMLDAAVPAGWHDLSFGLVLDLDWSSHIPAVNENIAQDGYSLFGIVFMAMLLKGLIVSIAGPAPNYDMQRILAARTPRESALMSFTVSLALVPRWLMIGGITMIGLVFLGDDLRGSSEPVDLEMLLPYVIDNFIPVGLVGVLLAGLLAAFMSTFSATLNAGAAYVVNDLYKRYFKKDATQTHYIRVSYLSNVLILLLGIFFGTKATSINQVTQWIVNALWGGYAAPNVLKWYWYRLNGYGYFWGMIAGMVAASVVPVLFPDMHPLHAFPYIFVASLAASIGGSLVTKPEDMETLKQFYRNVRPWGLWGPVFDRVVAEQPGFRRNTGFYRDAINVLVGIVWQMCLVVLPLYVVFWNAPGVWGTSVVLVATSAFLKKNWYDKLESETEAATMPERVQPETA